MKRVLAICNTPWQLFVVTWLKINILKNDDIYLLVSDCMVDGEKLATNAAKTDLFRDVRFVCRKKQRRLNRMLRILALILHSELILRKYNIPTYIKFDEMYTANFDNFTKLVYHTFANDIFCKGYNKDIKFFAFEDGISTYSKLMKSYYESCKKSWITQHKLPYEPKVIYKNVKAYYVFDKDGFLWDTGSEIIEMPKVDRSNCEFKNAVNHIFDYESMEDVYDRKYIFMEESFYAEGYKVDDVDLLLKLAKEVGRENIFVKIHPRNPENRFKKLGFKTNINTYIPWEIIILNQDITDKELYTISSTAVLNPAKVFGVFPKVHFMYDKLKIMPEILKGDLLEATKEAYNKYYNNSQN